MRLSAIFLLAGALHISAASRAQRVSFTGRNVPLTTVFKVLKQQAGYVVFYNYDIVQHTNPVTLDVKNVTVEELLEASLRGQGLDFSIEDKTVTLMMQVIPAVPVQPAPPPPPVTITGRITDEDGNPLPGVTIIVRGTTKGTQTDANGEYQLTTPDNRAVLIFTSIGFERMQLAAENRTTLNLRMRRAASKLTEIAVVNTGYQTISRERATGSFSVIDPARLENKLKPDLKAALEGQAAGVVLTKEGNVEIRGVSTFLSSASRAPLIVVDGYPINGGLETINIDNIASVTVLKDAVAASIYGARSSNGVIVVTTKQSAGGKLRVAYRGSAGVTLKPQLSYLNRANSSDYIDAEIDVYKQDPSDALNSYKAYDKTSPVVYYMLAKDNGWMSAGEADKKINQLRNNNGLEQLQRYYFRNQFTQQHNISLSGGSEKSMLNAAVKYVSNENNTIRNYDNRLLFDIKNDWKPNKDVTVRLFSNVSYATSAAPNSNWTDLLGFSPYGTIQPYDLIVDPATGKPQDLISKNKSKEDYYTKFNGLKPLNYNVLEDLTRQSSRTQDLLLRLGGSVNVRLFNNLRAEVGGMWSRGNTLIRNIYDKNSFTMRNLYNDNTSISNPSKHYIPDGNMIDETRSNNQAYMFRTQLNYSNDFGRKHRISLIAGNEISQYTTDNNAFPTRFGYNDQAGTFATFNYTDYNAGVYDADMLLANRTNAYIGAYTYQDNRFVSWYANGSYEYDNRFIVSGSIRLDQTNFFGTDPRYRYKPLWSAGATYKLAEEKFFHVPWISRLDIRGSYGINGNISLNAGPFLIIKPGSYSVYTGDVSYGISSPPNNSLRWEKTQSTNAGIDLSLFNQRLNVTLDYYRKYSTDLLAPDQVDPTRGFSSLTKNIGAMRNNGIELSVNADVVRRRNFSWNALANFSYNENKVTRYNVSYVYASSLTTSVRRVGDPLDAMYGYPFAGLDNNGVAQFYSDKGQKVSGGNVEIADMKYGGTLRPKYVIGFTNTFRYKNFDASFMIISKLGNVLRRDVFSGSNFQNKHVSERWRQPGDENTTIYPKLSSWNMDMFYFPYSDIFLESANYLKLRDVTLAYSLNRKLLKRIGFENVKIYFQTRNLFMLTANSDHRDPETAEINTTGGTGAFTEQGYTSLPLRPEFYAGITFSL